QYDRNFHQREAFGIIFLGERHRFLIVRQSAPWLDARGAASRSLVLGTATSPPIKQDAYLLHFSRSEFAMHRTLHLCKLQVKRLSLRPCHLRQRNPPLSTTTLIGFAAASVVNAGEVSIAPRNASIDFQSEETMLNGVRLA